MKIIKYTLLLILVLLVGGAIAIYNMDINSYKGEISAQLSSLTKSKVEIDGDIKLKVFPVLSLGISNVTIKDLKSSSYDVSAVVDSLQLYLKLKPLLSKKFIFDSINLSNLKLKAAKGTAKAKKNLQSQQSKSQNINVDIKKGLAIKSLSVKNSNLEIINNGTKIILDNFNATAKNIAVGQDFPIDIKSSLKVANEFSTDFNFSGKVKLSDVLDNSKIQGKLQTAGINLDGVNIDSTDFNIDAAPNFIKISPSLVKLYNGSVTGDISYDIKTQKLSFSQKVNALSIKAITGDPKVSGSIYADIKGNSQGDTLDKVIDNTNANIHLNSKNGSVSHINIKKIIAFVETIFDTKNISNITSINKPDFTRGMTTFDLLDGDFNLRKQVLLTNNLKLNSKEYDVKINGRYNLKNSGINFNLLATALSPSAKLAKIQNLLGGGFPIIVTGNIKKIIASPDLSKITSAVAKYYLEEKLLKTKLPDLKKGLKLPF